jgi:PAS domain S-box-containing protein
MDLPLATILNSLEDAILCVDENSILVLLNEAAAKVFGCDRAMAIGQHTSRFPVVADAVRQLNLHEVAGIGGASKAVRRLQISGGSEAVPMEAVVSCALVNGSRLYTAVIRDNSLQQKMEKEVYESRKTQAIGALASGIAHDFNNVLAAVISQIDLVLHSTECPV